MSRIFLYSKNTTDFANNGLGPLPDAVNCTVLREINGRYILTMTYPVDGLHFDLIEYDSVIRCQPAPDADPQPFYVVGFSRNIGGMVTVYAQHISYRLADIPVPAFAATSLSDALSKLGTLSVVSNPFTFSTDKTNSQNSFSVQQPSSVYSNLGGRAGSMIDVYGGEWDFDGWTATLRSRLGSNNGARIVYGKNMLAYQNDGSIESVYNGVYPFWKSISGDIVELPGKIVRASGSFDYDRIKPLDLSTEFREAPTTAQLQTRAEQYLSANTPWVPKNSFTVSFLDLTRSGEIDHVSTLGGASLGDDVAIYHSLYDVTTTSRVVSTTYNVLRDRFDSVEIGSVRADLASTIVGQDQSISATGAAAVNDVNKGLATLVRTVYSQPITSGTHTLANAVSNTLALIFCGIPGADTAETSLFVPTPQITSANKLYQLGVGAVFIAFYLRTEGSNVILQYDSGYGVISRVYAI